MMRALALSITLLAALPAMADTYPQDMRRAFMQSCAGLNRQLIQPCQCILRGVERSMSADEFTAILEKGNAESDRRVRSVMKQCRASTRR